jgi:hypothetical protein
VPVDYLVEPPPPEPHPGLALGLLHWLDRPVERLVDHLLDPLAVDRQRVADGLVAVIALPRDRGGVATARSTTATPARGNEQKN